MMYFAQSNPGQDIETFMGLQVSCPLEGPPRGWRAVITGVLELMTWQLPVLGGVLIGAGAVLMMVGAGRITGIIGILAGLLPPLDKTGWCWRLAFLVGLASGPLLVGLVLGADPVVVPRAELWVLAVAGLLVGLGTGLGRGCTSGHGVCGLARLSPRSLVATLVFMGTAMLVVFLVRHVIGQNVIGQNVIGLGG